MSTADFAALLPAAMGIYAEAMGYTRSIIPARTTLAQQHLGFPDFRSVAAWHNSELVGFGYGYRGMPGQWWYDHVAQMIRDHPSGDATADFWLSNMFELCELHVSPRFQGAGLGRGLLETLIDDTAFSTTLLSTPEGDTTAHHLYRRTGFIRVVDASVFPGDARRFAILGRRAGGAT
ncbi:MAG: GNAT family N-acetyltransferase [Antricoccus sp.]